ncbi:hypothetical protein ACQPZP_04285 [Spirillospora sp. CA-142024]|uniref:hypothetical protein n=1 Tax=Spirillospora sp. CA-142024 TaxID=3240036 RepID=UPI003D8DC7FA
MVYCRGEYCVPAYDAVRLLTDRGHRAIRLHDGMLEWRLADLPVHASRMTADASAPVPPDPHQIMAAPSEPRSQIRAAASAPDQHGGTIR